MGVCPQDGSSALPVRQHAELVDRPAFLAYLAGLYYEDGLTQSEIGRQVRMSRSSVSRVLNKARERGIVEFVIHFPWSRSRQLERQLVRDFSLRDARVLAKER